MGNPKPPVIVTPEMATVAPEMTRTLFVRPASMIVVSAPEPVSVKLMPIVSGNVSPSTGL